MWRGNLANEIKRIKNFTKDIKKISKLLKYLLKTKKVKEIYIFPYTKAFLERSLKYNFFDNICVYRNPKETEFDKFIKHNKKHKFITIRPFGGKLKLLRKHKLKYLLNYSISNNNIKRVILTCSNKKQIGQIVSFCNDKKNF